MTRDEIHDALTELWFYFDDRADVLDGDDGQPRADANMRRLQAIEAIRTYIARLEARGTP